MTGNGVQPALEPELGSALRSFADHRTVLVALDFDGVMAPLVDRAEDARPLPENADALASLTGLAGVHTALVSGRALESLTAVAAPPAATLLIGSHGAERRLGPDAPPLILTDTQQAALVAAERTLESLSATVPGSWVEHKPAGRVLHVRQVSDPAQARDVVGTAETALAALAGEHPEITVGHGKAVLETSVVRADKGQGLELLRQTTGAEAVLFAGDDVTDESGFARLRPGVDVGIKVGQGPTAAPFRIAGPQALAGVLQAVAQWRA